MAFFFMLEHGVGRSLGGPLRLGYAFSQRGNQERQNTMINGNRGTRGSLAHTARPTKIGTNGRDTTPRSKEARKERAPVGTHIKEQSQEQIRP